MFQFGENFAVDQGVPYAPGSLSLFLPESPHTVTPLTSGERSILFMWFHCRQFTTPPERYQGLSEAIGRGEKVLKSGATARDAATLAAAKAQVAGARAARIRGIDSPGAARGGQEKKRQPHQ